ncbi:acetyltransferase, GNAT family protein [Trichomonas vaginalis G3]|uniref:histone acetyltransferase n=1 Tax=Trichomonas vaginalis (strain ATCC PRA-98 / G3) TaxID=412133 RepID=A2FYQ3_TRIV3|nr:histone acetyltransferase protein [Trichomonas vaginalis G3]EAX89975.1 acetyltransferase, GNAT family protein [Trichomonas vaginalis G3]KAI5547845.1 histone acetyltransferase protein [Trichomonas vaginalis G3]|eukprot:XP_001302905.1 acetyltransferase, GNAT family protein [Trichomonas vaginalis G3]
MKPSSRPYPSWGHPERPDVEPQFHRLDATDFNVSLEPSIKSKSFREYDTEIQYRLITNDSTDQSLIWLTMARNIFHHELSQMPENYISKLVFNKNHFTCVLILDGMVFGGICFRPFFDRDFAEIAFCAVSSTGQIKGYGSHIMSQVKTYMQAMQIHNVLTYADNSAVGYFNRQGFTLQINLDPQIWRHCIKDYQGATLIHCKLYPSIDYLRINDVIDAQLRWTSDLLPDYPTRITRVWPIKRFSGVLINSTPTIDVTDQMRIVVDKVKHHSRSWPFRKPVSKNEAPNYFEIIKFPMDLSTLEKNVYDGKYTTFQKFEADLRLIFSNCYMYNKGESVYRKSAIELERFVNQLLASQKVRSHISTKPK